MIDDTEVHLARGDDGTYAALKVARASAMRDLTAALDHEAAVLAELSGEVTPKLLGRGADEGRECLAVEWCAGLDVLEASAELRDTQRVDELLDLGERVLDAYAHLHAEGFLHGDVHPRNILVEAGGRVRLIDFGLAARIGAADRVPRGGIDLFLEPELAGARLAGLPAPPASPAGEQYSVAALLYLVLTGAHTHVFSLDEERMHRQLLDDPPLPFAVHDARGLEIVEPVLARALSKRPGDRFESLEAFRDSYRAARKPRTRAGRKHSSREAQLLADEVVDRLSGPLAEGELEPPTASINLGAAGLAYGALRIAAARDDASLLALAERWAARAALSASSSAGFENPELDITPENYGRSSLYHSAVGVHCVGALVARARGDELLQRVEIEAARRIGTGAGQRSSMSPSARRERSSVARSSWRQSRRPSSSPPRVTSSPNAWLRVFDSCRRSPTPSPRRRSGQRTAGPGISTRSSAGARPAGLHPRPKSESGSTSSPRSGVPLGRGMRWPREVALPASENALGASWCNGAAGLVHLWLAAERLLGDTRFGRLAEAAAWTAYDAPDAGGDLCCGAAGRAYALLAVHRQLGGGAWLDRGIALAERAARAVRRDPLRRDSLYKGEVGVAVLAADLGRPDWAAMPLFEREGWPRPS